MKLQFVISKRRSSAGITKSRPGSRKTNASLGLVRLPSRESQFRERDFLSRIDAWVLERWEQRARTFRELLSGLPGIYPAEVLCSLRRLRCSARIDEFDVHAVELDAASRPVLHSKPVAPERQRQCIEHPLDFEWRFTREGVARICEEIEKLGLEPRSEVLCIGCPSVYSLGKENLGRLSFQLWDKNAPTGGQIEEAREICRVDMNNAASPFPSVATVVIDPPWYPEFYQLFIWAGFHCLPAGGSMLLSFPPQGTRPSVVEDLNALIKWCSMRGLVLEERKPCSLPYRSPLFEVNALKGQGVSNFPLNWRRGDLLLLKKQTSKSFDKPKCSLPSEKWEEIKVRASRVRVHQGRKIHGAIFRPAGESEVLPSVSSKQLARRRANVVTSGNRFFCTSVPEEVLDCLAAIDASGPDRMRRSFLASRRPLLMRKVADMVSKEEREAAEYFRRIHEI
jgi:hypothetical protein